MTKIKVTLKALRQHGACIGGYNKLVRTLQNKEFSEEDEERKTYIQFAHAEPIPLDFILESNGLDDALWSLRACEQTPEMVRAERLYAVWCARQVQHLMTDPRSLAALDVAERHAHGGATDDELNAAGDAAGDAARDAGAAGDAAGDAAGAAGDAAGDATRAAAWAAAREAARAASWAASWAAAMDTAGAAARDATWAAVRAASWEAAADAQKQRFLAVFCEVAPKPEELT